MRADRLLSALLQLQAHGQLSGRELAKRLEVSTRTVHRDMEALSAAGVPVYATRGSNGGWRLDEKWRTQVPGLDEPELRGLFLSQPRVLGDPSLAAAAERAMGKLLAALPDKLRDKALSIRQRLYVDTITWRPSREDLTALPAVQDAVWSDRRLSFDYLRPGGERTKRIVDPLGLVSKGVVWYLVANTPAGLRTYRVSRMDSIVVLDEASQRPIGFDLATYWKTTIAEFQETMGRFAVIFRMQPRAAQWAAKWHPTEFKDSDSSKVIVEIQFDSEEEAGYLATGFGPLAEVLEPASLRENIKAKIDEMRRLYGM